MDLRFKIYKHSHIWDIFCKLRVFGEEDESESMVNMNWILKQGAHIMKRIRRKRAVHQTQNRSNIYQTQIALTVNEIKDDRYRWDGLSCLVRRKLIKVLRTCLECNGNLNEIMYIVKIYETSLRESRMDIGRISSFRWESNRNPFNVWYKPFDLCQIYCK